ncbi:hypothetical protein MGA5115_01237 [Marinomonas gallaica]|uniref:Uncharacterized protein n=1 Tax=Marinomonas gallaica TaxID=1806667 RepID=A0A1C3JPV8_9GAMM|nr:hypothetical protein [Marinomonas gallaica]SBT17147.1 hypothetical protein MGA5115_01237 [Marinomonas gallaica]SBT19482.1 hypothetical protein MGA5116_00036 [Marinomonas gallaica]
MAKQYAEVHQDDFMKFGGDRLSYLDIEDDLMALAGHGVAGNNFKKEILKMAGWTGGALTTYAQRPVVAANAFNKVREGLAKVSTAEELKAFLQS